MQITIGLPGGRQALSQAIRSYANINYEPLMETWRGLIREGNVRGVLAGIDKDGQPIRPVTYRPRSPKPGTRRPLNYAQRGLKDGTFVGKGISAAGLNNNLTYGEYLRLTGPPLAPRFGASRVITNFATGVGIDGEGHHYVEAGWFEVVDEKARPFLAQAFRVRDLRGVRPDDVRLLQGALFAFLSGKFG